MVIRPKIKGCVCVTAHPAGCAAHVQEQIRRVKEKGVVSGGPRKILIIGASTGYGLSARITGAFSAAAATLGVFLERPSQDGDPATAGWYNTAAFHSAAKTEGLWAKSINGDAFSDQVKKQTIAAIKQDLGQVDLVLYSLAAPRRHHPRTGETYRSALKPIGRSCLLKNLDTDQGVVHDITLPPATEEEIAATVAVMGGEDWTWWMEALTEADVLAEGAAAVAFDYEGPEITWPIYKEGTIGRAKEDLRNAIRGMNQRLRRQGRSAFLSVHQASVTQASAAIPVMPLYVSILFRVLREKGLFEDTIEQACRLFAEQLAGDAPHAKYELCRVRLDDKELRSDVQMEVSRRWEAVNTDNLDQLADFPGYRQAFLQFFGFGLPGVDYEASVDPSIPLP